MSGLSERLINVGLAASAALLLALNAGVSLAHDWWDWHWHTGSNIEVLVDAVNAAESNAALNDWDTNCDVNFPRRNAHTQMSVFAADFGATGWAGLATVESYTYDWWHKWNYSKIEHCHARFNKHYNYSSADIQGVLCQEIGHCMGLDHSNDGCMGKGYFNNLNKTVAHNWADCNSRF
jgi:hypothetical protein